VDQIAGTMRRDWRLDMAAPFALQSATSGVEPLLVTSGTFDHTGLEVRNPKLSLTTVARSAAHGAMPATGWNQRFDQVSGVLHLPPGHRLIAAPGTDEAPGSWIERWGLWSVFGVLIVVVFVYWIAGLMPAGIAALAFLLTYQEMPPFIWLWANLLAALAIARTAPEGRFRRVAHGYRTLSFSVLALAMLPFMWSQVRYALYPQLENTQFEILPLNVQTAVAPESKVDVPRAVNAPAAPADAVEANAAAPATPAAAEAAPRPPRREFQPDRQARRDRHERQQRAERQGQRSERRDQGGARLGTHGNRQAPRGDRPRRKRDDGPDRAEREQYYAKPHGSGGRNKEPDPNSPFAKLAALKQQLEQKEPS